MKKEIEFDDFSYAEIMEMIRKGKCTNADVVRYYNNEWWAENPDNCTFRYPRIQY